MALTSPRADRATVMAALAARRLDRTLTTALPACDPTDDMAVGPTSVAAFDRRLGGVPRGQVSELIGPASSGRTSLLLRMCAAAVQRGELVALIDPLDRFDPESALAAGVDLDRLLWVRGSVLADSRACRDANQRALEQAIKALSLVLQAGNFGLVAFDVADAPAEAVRRLPFTTWLRIQRMVEGSQTSCVIVAAQPIARSAAGLSIVLQPPGQAPAAVGDTRASAPAGERAWRFGGGLFDGVNLQARVVRARARQHDELAVPLQTRVAYGD